MFAALSFIADLPLYRSQKPFEIIGLSEKELPNEHKTNIIYETHDSVPITDVRTSSETLSLDTCGFSWIRHQSCHLASASPFISADEDNHTVHAFLQETIQLAKKELSANLVYVYDWRYRKNGTIYNDRELDEDIKNSRYLIYAPIGYVHSDYSYQGGLDRIFLHLTEAERVGYEKQGANLKLVNAWRPLKPVENAPLAVCDRRSVRPEDVIEVDKVLPNNLELETCIYHRPYHKWYYMSRQSPSEVLFFIQWEKCDNPSQTASVPHASLGGPEATLGSLARESVEVRMIVIS